MTGLSALLCIVCVGRPAEEVSFTASSSMYSRARKGHAGARALPLDRTATRFAHESDARQPRRGCRQQEQPGPEGKRNLRRCSLAWRAASAAEASVASLALARRARAIAIASVASLPRRSASLAPLWATRRRGSTGRWLLQRVGDHLHVEMQVLTQVLDALIGEEPIVMLPGKALSDILTRRQRGEQLDHLQVGDALDLGVCLEGVVLLRDHHPLLEEIRQDRQPILLLDQHGAPRGRELPKGREVT